MKRILVTGGSRGIGQVISQTLRDYGNDVFTPGRNELDLLNPRSIDDYFIANGQFDILINNAGINELAEISEIDASVWSDMVQTNLTAPMTLIQKVIPHMKEKKWGRIINISSIFSLISKEKRGAYSSVKAGLNGLTRTASLELGPYGILVNSICPGYVETDLTLKNNSAEDIKKIVNDIPLKRMAAPKEIAELVVFLASERNSYITGQAITIDGGFTIK